MRFSLFTIISGAPSSSRRFRRELRLMTRRYRSLRSEVAKRPPSSCTMGRSSGGMIGTASSTMPSGELSVVKNALTTFNRFKARVFRCPRPVWMISWSFSASPCRSKVCRRRWIDSAPMEPSKYSPYLSRMARKMCSSPSRSPTLRFLKRSQTSSIWSISASARLRTWPMVFSARDLAFSRSAALAPAFSSCASSSSRSWEIAAISESSCFFRKAISWSCSA